MTYLIDSDWVIDVLNGQHAATATLIQLAPHGLFLSVATYGELYEGAYYSRDPQKALADLRTCLAGKTILPITEPIMEQFGIIRGALPRNLRQQMGDMDVQIAATALSFGMTLVTRNIKDFQHVPGLVLYQP